MTARDGGPRDSSASPRNDTELRGTGEHCHPERSEGSRGTGEHCHPERSEGSPRRPPGERPILEIQGLVKHFPLGAGLFGRSHAAVRAVDGVDLAVAPRECLAIVGESGSGKTTLGRCAVRLLEPTAGRVLFDGRDLAELSARELRRERRRFQMIFQDPFGSLNPRMRIGAAIEEPLTVHRLGDRAERRRRVAELLETVGLAPEAASRYPHEFSGGQRQRVGIARALATGPELVVADEPVSALDVSVRAQVVNLLARLQERFGLALVFIAHDLALVEHLADRVAVMYLGRIVEEAPRDALFASPAHPYTASLLSAVPVPEPGSGRSRVELEGEPPSPVDPPSGCPFHPRCPIARPRCAQETPPLAPVGAASHAATHVIPSEARDLAVADRGDPSVAPLRGMTRGGASHRAACFYPFELAPPPLAASPARGTIRPETS